MTYRQILAELEAANKWLSSLGIREQQDRIRKHMQRITQLEEARQAGKLAEASQGENGRLAMFSLTEAMEFLDIYSAFKDDPPTQISQRLKNALDGPADLADETARSNRGRNTMFELNLASRLQRSGLLVLLKTNPDVLCQLDEHPMYVQCKRPFRIETIAENIKDA